jgi:glycosyltransferase involved in cell wall biosynthesis
MKVSVVIPVYNEEKYIGKCLDSLMKQSEKAAEIIVVDNNSQDNTLAIVEKYPGIKIIKEKLQGTTPTRNRGFNEAKGEIIARCDADTILPPNWVKKITKAFSANKNVVALSTATAYHDLPLLNRSYLPSDMIYYTSKAILGFPAMFGPSMAISKKAWLKVKKNICLDDRKVHEDIDLSIHIKKYGEIIFLPDVFVKISARRIKKDPMSFFVEYPLRLIKMIKSHRHLFQFLERGRLLRSFVVSEFLQSWKSQGK